MALQMRILGGLPQGITKNFSPQKDSHELFFPTQAI